MNFRTALVLSASTILAGCASSGPQCRTAPAMVIHPLDAAADSSANAPANQQSFQASVAIQVVQQGDGSCPLSALRTAVHPAWANPDPDHLTISSADDATNGLATCIGATAGPVTLTATLPAGSTALGTTTKTLIATAQLVCK